MFGIGPPDRLVGTSAAAVVRRIKAAFADPGEFVRRTSEAFAAREPADGQQLACADGRTLECDYWPVMVDGRYRGDIWLAWDMSDRKALETQRQELLDAELTARRAAELAQRKLERQNRQLQELGEARKDFVATVSHELRTPLTSIVSFIDLMQAEADGLSEDGAHFLSIIQRNANRLIRLVGDLLLLNQLESGMIPLELAPVPIPELTREAVRDASAAAAGYGVTLDAAGTNDGPMIQGDHLRLRQVLDNLIANAVKFSHPGDVVRVVSTWDGGVWRIDVTDTGIGIPAAEIGRPLRPLCPGLQRANLRPARHRSRPFRRPGDRRSAWWPRHRGKRARPWHHVQHLLAGAGMKGRVLVIEDDADVALSIQTVLSRSGFDVASSADGRQGLRDFHARRPDLVVLDIGLPSLDGWEVLERIRDMSDVPVLLLTARGHEGEKVRGLDSGADDYLTKPFGNRELAARVHALLRRPRAQREDTDSYDDGTVLMKFASHEVSVNAKPVELTPTEFRLLGALVRHQGQTLSPEQLLELAWNDPFAVGPERVKFAVMRLRRKLGQSTAASLPIEAVRGFGYRYVAPAADVPSPH